MKDTKTMLLASNRKILTEEHNDEKIAFTPFTAGTWLIAYHFLSFIIFASCLASGNNKQK